MSEFQRDNATFQPSFSSVVQLLRPKQWIKNSLVLIPLLTSQNYRDAQALGNAFVAVLTMCLAASSIYALNDIFDLQNDRKHPDKQHRPLAASKLSVAQGYGVAAGLTLLVVFATRVVPDLGLPLTFYYVLNILYSTGLKKIAVLDIFLLTGFYSIRIWAGAAAIGVSVSNWLILLAFFIFLSLAIAKRYSELLALPNLNLDSTSRRGYIQADLPLLLTVGPSASLLSTLIYMLYVSSDIPVHLYTRHSLLWIDGPLILFCQLRIWLYCIRSQQKVFDPILFALKDRWSWIAGGAMVAVVVLAK